MSTPKDVLRQPTLEPLRRMQNVPAEVTPAAVEGFEHHAGYSIVAGLQARFLSTWGFPWWTADRMTGYGSGAYGAGPYGTTENAGEFGALRYGRGAFGTGGYS